MFIDIVNFTELSKDEDPRRVVELLNKIFTKYDTISNKYGLEKIKTIGDSYMAAAGIPEVQIDNTHRAAQMALEVKEMMQDYFRKGNFKQGLVDGILKTGHELKTHFPYEADDIDELSNEISKSS